MITEQCFRCKNRIPAARMICLAFDGEIPGAILQGKHDHREPYPGDNGIRFEPIEGTELGTTPAPGIG